MVKIIKSNVTARKISLVENEHQVSLFQQDSIHCSGLYLKHYQKATLTTSPAQKILLYVTTGNGELEVTQDSEQLHLQLLKDDVLLLPANGTYQVTNVAEQACTLCVITINTSQLKP